MTKSDTSDDDDDDDREEVEERKAREPDTASPDSCFQSISPGESSLKHSNNLTYIVLKMSTIRVKN